jgi:hypothetical protein
VYPSDRVIGSGCFYVSPIVQFRDEEKGTFIYRLLLTSSRQHSPWVPPETMMLGPSSPPAVRPAVYYPFIQPPFHRRRPTLAPFTRFSPYAAAAWATKNEPRQPRNPYIPFQAPQYNPRAERDWPVPGFHLHTLNIPCVCRQNGAYGRSRALKRKRTLGGGHCGEDTGRRGAGGESRGFVEGSTNRAAMERGRVCEERGRMERKQAACRFIAAFMGACPVPVPGFLDSRSRALQSVISGAIHGGMGFLSN